MGIVDVENGYLVNDKSLELIEKVTLSMPWLVPT